MFLAIALRSLLAIALLGGGLSSWTMGASAMSASAMSASAMSTSAMSMSGAAQDHGDETGLCHHTPDQAADDSLTLAPGIDQCADSDECEYPSCNHLCTVAGAAVPVRAQTSFRAAITCPPVAFAAPSPHNLSSPPKRPPRA